MSRYIELDDDKSRIIETKIETFLDNLIRLHNNRNPTEIKKILDINNVETEYKNREKEKTEKKYVSVRASNNIKRTINSIRYILPGKVFTIWIENIIVLWVNKLNKKEAFEINLIFENYNNDDHDDNSSNSINFTIDTMLWNSFVLRCRRSGFTISDGMRYAIIDFILSKTL